MVFEVACASLGPNVLVPKMAAAEALGALRQRLPKPGRDRLLHNGGGRPRLALAARTLRLRELGAEKKSRDRGPRQGGLS